MSKVTTTYDNTLKEKIFIVKGEEGYARSTDCILTELYTNDGERRADWNTSLRGMKLEFRINVLRDVGASQVVLYDNDTTIGVYDFDTNTHSIDLKYESDEEDNRIILSYGVEHHIYAKYMGNKQCMKSQSQSYIVDEPIPDAFNCELVFTDEYGEDLTTFEYDTAPEIHLGIKLVAESYISGNTIQIYDNDELILEDTTDSEGAIAFALHKSPLIDNGLHRLKAKFNGTQYLESKSATVDISVGYQVTVEEYPQYRVNGEPINIVAKVQSYLGNPPSTMMSTGHYVVKGATDSPVAIPDENGYLYFDDVQLSRQFFMVGLETLLPPEYIDYVSEAHNVIFLDGITLSLSANPSIISNNYSSTVTATLSALGIQGIPINFNDEIIYTDSNSQAKYTIDGSASGDIPVSASIYNSSKSVLVEDVVQYWSKLDARLINREWDIRSGVINSATNGWKCTPASNNYYVMNLSLCEFSHSLELIIRSASAVDYVRYCGIWVAQTSLKAGDVIRFDYDYDDEIVSFYKNNVLVSTHDIPKDTQVSWGFRATSTGYVVFDKLKLKRIE